MIRRMQSDTGPFVHIGDLKIILEQVAFRCNDSLADPEATDLDRVGLTGIREGVQIALDKLDLVESAPAELTVGEDADGGTEG